MKKLSLILLLGLTFAANAANATALNFIYKDALLGSATHHNVTYDVSDLAYTGFITQNFEFDIVTSSPDNTSTFLTIADGALYGYNQSKTGMIGGVNSQLGTSFTAGLLRATPGVYDNIQASSSKLAEYAAFTLNNNTMLMRDNAGALESVSVSDVAKSVISAPDFAAAMSTATAVTPHYPSRALNSCFLISSSLGADFHYAVDVTAALVLGGGTATITSYTNSSCTTGAQTMRDGTISGIIAGGTTSINLDGYLSAGKYAKITVSNTGLGATSAIRASQQEKY